MPAEDYEAPHLIAALSEGDPVSPLKLGAIDATLQDVKETAREEFRPRLRSMGIGHAFFRGRLWLAPLDGSTHEASAEIVRPFLGDAKEVRTIEIDLEDDYHWSGVGKKLVRDAIAHALIAKENPEVGLVARGSSILDVAERQPVAGGALFVVPGLDLHRVFRASNNRILVACSMLFRVLDSDNARVQDRGMTTSLLTKAYAHGADLRWGWIERTAQKAFPLEIRLGDRTLLLNRLGVPIKVARMVKAWS